MAAKKTPSILNLDEEIRRDVSDELTKGQKDKLKQLKKDRIKQKKFNYKQGAKKRKIRIALKKRDASENEIKKEQNKIVTYSLKVTDNKINKISKREFFYTVYDNFNKPYKIKIKNIGKIKNFGVKILEKMKDAIEEDLVYEKKIGRKKMVKVLNKLLNNVNFNLEALKTGKYPKLITESMKDQSFVPMYIETVLDIIKINV